MIEENGEISFAEADHANIPVNIWLIREKETGKWNLTADNYIPRKVLVSSEQYKAVSESREELVALVRNHIVPLYETALKKLGAICDGTKEDLYYWTLKF